MNLFEITPDMDEETKAELLAIQEQERILMEQAATERAAAQNAERQADAAASEDFQPTSEQPETGTTEVQPEAIPAAQTAAEAAPSAGQPAPADDIAEQLRKAQARAASADGIARAAGSQLSQAQQRIRELEALLVDRVAIAPGSSPAGGAPEAGAPITDADLEVLNNTLGDTEASQAILKVIESRIGRIKSELDPIRQTVEQQIQAASLSARQRYDEAITREFPDSAQIAESPEFRAFMGTAGMDLLYNQYRSMEVDQTTGQPLALQHFKLFERYKSAQAPQPAAVAPTPNPSDAQRAAIAAQAAPRTAATGAPAGPRVYTRAQADALYRRAESDDSLSGEQAAKLFAEVERAEREGRVRG